MSIYINITLSNVSIFPNVSNAQNMSILPKRVQLHIPKRVQLFTKRVKQFVSAETCPFQDTKSLKSFSAYMSTEHVMTVTSTSNATKKTSLWFGPKRIRRKPIFNDVNAEAFWTRFSEIERFIELKKRK